MAEARMVRETGLPARIAVVAVRSLVLTALALVFILPFYWMIVGSFKDFAEFYALPPILFPRVFRISNYIQMITQFPLIRYVVNSIFIGLTITVAQLLVTSLAGYAFSTLEFRGKRVLFLIFLSGMMVPLSVILIPLYFIVNQMGMVDTYLGIILPCVFSGYGIFLMRQFFLSIPRDLHDASVMDGCPELRIYWRIYVPLSVPVFLTLGIQCFVYFYNSFLWPLIVTNSQAKKTVPVGLMEFIYRDVQWPHLVMAGATFCVLPTIILFIALQKYYVRGISMTGLKV